MKKNNKINSKAVSNALKEFNDLAGTLKENTRAAVQDLLEDTVKSTFSKLINEEDEDEDSEYDVEEVDDTDSEDVVDTENEDSASDDNDDENDEESPETDDLTDDDDSEDDTVETPEDSDEDIADTEDEADDEEDSWDGFDKYQTSEGEYDFSNAEDDEVVKVYKLLKNDDQVVVKREDDGKVSIKDNESDTEYIVDFDDNDSVNILPSSTNSFEFDIDAEPDDTFDDNTEDYNDEDDLEDMNESVIYEIALNEYDSNVGYTDNYQKDDVIDSKGLSAADDKDSNDWGSKGLRDRGGKKPWSGKRGSKSENSPFIGEKGKTVEEANECDQLPMEEEDDVEMPVEEATNVGGFVHQRSSSKSHVPNSNGRPGTRTARHISKNGKYRDGMYGEGGEDTVAEAKKFMEKANKIYEQNEYLKKKLSHFRDIIKEASITNVNLGQIIKLISENSTSKDEKKEIIGRFGNVHTVKEAQNLYESISNDLKKRNKMSINEDNQFTAQSSKQINETQIYKSKDLLDSLDLMHRLCK